MSEDEGRLATYVILPAARGQIMESANEAAQLLSVLKDWEIVTAADEEQAASLLSETHERHKALEKQRKEVVGPAVAAQREINDLFRVATKGWNDAKDLVKLKLTHLAARRQEEQRKLLEQAAQGDGAALAKMEPKPPAPAGVAYRPEVEIKIVDENAIPREYLCIDWSALKIAAREGKPAPPGVEFRVVDKARVG
jgi:hypothetical protein